MPSFIISAISQPEDEMIYAIRDNGGYSFHYKNTNDRVVDRKKATRYSLDEATSIVRDLNRLSEDNDMWIYNWKVEQA